MRPKLTQIEAKLGVPMKEILDVFYSQNHYSYREIADFLGADGKSIREWARELGIKSRSQKEADAYKFKEKVTPELLLRRLTGHLALCICPQCPSQEQCSRGREWHEKGYCVMTCAERR